MNLVKLPQREGAGFYVEPSHVVVIKSNGGCLTYLWTVVDLIEDPWIVPLPIEEVLRKFEVVK